MYSRKMSERGLTCSIKTAKKLLSKENLQKEIDSFNTIRTIGFTYGINHNVVRKLLFEYKIFTNLDDYKFYQKLAVRKVKVPRDTLIKVYYNKNYTYKDMSNILGIRRDQIEKLVDIYKLEHLSRETIINKQMKKIYNMNTKNNFSLKETYLGNKKIKMYKANQSGYKSRYKMEEEAYELLCTKYDKKDIIREYYNEDSYPYNCDFYIKSKDLYIECNFHTSHGGKLYEGTKEDKLQYNKATKCCKRWYKNVWMSTDVEKYKCLKDNNLNFKIFYTIQDLNIYLARI